MCAVIIHGVGSAQLVVDAIDSELVSDHTGGYLGTGVSFADFNGDGLDDLTFGHHNGALSFYAGNGDGFDPIDLGLELPTAEAKGVLWADIDNDGDQDLFVAYRFAPNKLWLNDGEMGFEDVSSSCGIAQDNRRSFGPAFGDFDRDGLLDLFVANYGYAVDVPQGNELYRNVGGGQFEDVTAEFGLDGENLQSFQATWMDVDRDGWLDLHVIRDRLIFPNLFYHNKAEEQGAVWFEEEAQVRKGMDAMLNCMSSSPHDYDRDGDLDLFIAGGLEGNMLLVNNGDGYYTDATNDLVQMNEVCWSGQWLDVDADGWEELHVATGFANYTDYPQVLFQFSDEPDALFHNDAGNLVEAGELYQSESSLAFCHRHWRLRWRWLRRFCFASGWTPSRSKAQHTEWQCRYAHPFARNREQCRCNRLQNRAVGRRGLLVPRDALWRRLPGAEQPLGTLWLGEPHNRGFHQGPVAPGLRGNLA